MRERSIPGENKRKKEEEEEEEEEETFVIARTYKTYLFFDLNLLEFFLNFFESSGLELQIKINSFNALLVKPHDSQIFGIAFLTICNNEPIPSWGQQLQQLFVAGKILYYAESQQMVQTCLKSSKQTCFYIRNFFLYPFNFNTNTSGIRTVLLVPKIPNFINLYLHNIEDSIIQTVLLTPKIPNFTQSLPP